MIITETTMLSDGELAFMLAAWADGSFAVEAAVELLVAHERWLGRGDFRRELVDAVDDGWGSAGVVPMAVIAWDRVGTFLESAPCSSSEQAMLMLAASLAGATNGVSLQTMTRGLDDHNARLALDALCHRFGWHRSGSARSPGRHGLCHLRAMQPVVRGATS